MISTRTLWLPAAIALTAVGCAIDGGDPAERSAESVASRLVDACAGAALQPVALVDEPVGSISSIAASDTHIHYVLMSADGPEMLPHAWIKRVPKTGGPPETIGEEIARPDAVFMTVDLAADQDSVYWTREDLNPTVPGSQSALKRWSASDGATVTVAKVLGTLNIAGLDHGRPIIRRASARSTSSVGRRAERPRSSRRRARSTPRSDGGRGRRAAPTTG